MDVADCPHCAGTGYTTDDTGRGVICPVCEDTGVVYLDAEGSLVVDDDHWR